MNSTNENKSSYIDTLYLAVGELITAILICVGFLIADLCGLECFDYTVITGSILGGAVTVLNFFILSFAANRAINNYIELRGQKEMDEEEAADFARKHGMDVQNAVTKSFILRTLLMLGTLVLAFISGVFNVMATLIPLIMYRPIIYITELIKRKRGG